MGGFTIHFVSSRDFSLIGDFLGLFSPATPYHIGDPKMFVPSPHSKEFFLSVFNIG